MTRWLILSLACAVCATAEAPADTLFITGSLYQGRTGGGGAGSFDWIHNAGERAIFSAGLAKHELGGSRWTLGRGGIAYKNLGRWTLGGHTAIGSGRAGTAGFSYRTIEARTDFRIAQRVFARSSWQHLAIGESRGLLTSAGILFPVSQSSTVDAGYTFSSSGNLGTNFLSARLDRATRRARFFGGGSAGYTSPDLFRVEVGSSAGRKQLRQYFLGTGLPLHGTELLVSIEVIQLNRTTRSILTVGLRLPVSRR